MYEYPEICSVLVAGKLGMTNLFSVESLSSKSPSSYILHTLAAEQGDPMML
jgi:hypothetical protein